MPFALTDGIVCIINASGRVVGAGFVVSSNGLIVTCAHVIGEPGPNHVTLVFQATNEQREAIILSEYWRSERTEDMAILQLVGSLPEGVISAVPTYRFCSCCKFALIAQHLSKSGTPATSMLQPTVIKTHYRNSPKPPQPYVERLINFSRLICPSTGPVDLVVADAKVIRRCGCQMAGNRSIGP